MWTKPLAEFLLVEPACSPLNAVAQHATDHLSSIDATHRTHVQKTVAGAEVGADEMIHPDKESGLFLCFLHGDFIGCVTNIRPPARQRPLLLIDFFLD